MGYNAEKGDEGMNGRVLALPDETMLDQISAYRQAFLESGEPMAGTGCLRQCENPADWLRSCRRHARKETVPAGRVPSTQWVYLHGGEIVGMLDIRHELNDDLAQYGGHIGYSVHPGHRRRGYASAMLRDALAHCRALGLERVLITCDADNEASRRTILKNGGTYESTVHEPGEDMGTERYWIAL